MNWKKLQIEFFTLVRQKNKGSDIILIKELQELLNLSKSTLYKRLNGDIKMTLDELMTIAVRYNVSIDNLLPNEQSNITLQLRSMANQPKSFNDFLDPILANLSLLNQLDEKDIWYATNELPFFHYMHFPRLAAFKLYVWGRSVWNIKEILNSTFTIASANEDFRELIRKTLGLYESVPSKEFWGIHILDTTLNQIKYCLEGQLFENPEQAILLLQDLDDLLDLLTTNAAKGKKSGKGSFTLYHNEMLYTNNMILIKTAHYGDCLYATYDNPNFMYTRDPNICEYTNKWFIKLKRNAQCISLENEKYRHQYFRALKNRVSKFKTELYGKPEKIY